VTCRRQRDAHGLLGNKVVPKPAGNLPASKAAVLVPILKQGAYLIVTVQSALSDADFDQLRKSLVESVGKARARGVIFDLTAIDVMDSFSCRMLRDIAHMVGLRGAEMVVVGIQPEVAFAMVQLGSTLEGVVTSLDLEEGLVLLDRAPRRTK
jgi:rsbT antagonist protein RsbS